MLSAPFQINSILQGACQAKEAITSRVWYRWSIPDHSNGGEVPVLVCRTLSHHPVSGTVSCPIPQYYSLAWQCSCVGGHLLILLPLSHEVWKNPLPLSLSNFLHSRYHKRPLRNVSSSIPILHIKINFASLVGTNFIINGSLIFFFS